VSTSNTLKIAALPVTVGLLWAFGPQLKSLTGQVTGDDVEISGTEYAPYFVDLAYLAESCSDLAFATCGADCERYPAALRTENWATADSEGPASTLMQVCEEVFAWDGNYTDNAFNTTPLPLWEPDVPLVGTVDDEGTVLSLSDGWEFYDFNMDLMSQACGELDDAVCGIECGVYPESLDGTPYESDESDGWVYGFENLCYEWTANGADYNVFPELGAAAAISGDLDEDDYLSLWIVESVGSHSWDGFNVLTTNKPTYQWLDEPPYNPTEVGQQAPALLGLRACSLNEGSYLQSNSREGDGTSWGPRDATIAWQLDYDGTLANGAVVQLKSQCTDESCEDTGAYFHSNAGQGGGTSWGDSDPDSGWIIEWDDASLVSGGVVYLRANCPEGSESAVCREGGTYFRSNSVEGAGQSFGDKSYQYTWTLEWDGTATAPPASGSSVYLGSHCSGLDSVWTSPEGESVTEDECLSIMTRDELFQVLVDYGAVDGDPDSYTLGTKDDWRGTFDRMGAGGGHNMTYFWGIDHAFHVLDAFINQGKEPELNDEFRQYQMTDWKVNNLMGLVNSEKCISRGELGQLVSGIVPALQLDAGDNHTCMVGNDGSGHMRCWGNNEHGQTNVPAGMWKDTAAGSAHTCGIRVDGYIDCWGDNSKGQLDAPTGRYKEISSMGNHACALDFDGAAVCWGEGATTAPAAEFVQMSASGSHACGLTYDNEVLCWGANDKGQLAAPSDSFDTVSVGNGFSCGVGSELREAICWGDGAKAVTNDQNMGHYSLSAGPTSHCSINRWHDKAFGDYQSTFCDGGGEHVGMDPFEGFLPVQSVGLNHACAQTRLGPVKVICWGNNEFGQTEVPASLSALVLGDKHACGSDGGRLQCSGDNSYGQGTPPPPYIGPDADYSELVAGKNHTCGRRGHHWQSGEIVCWGDNTMGQVEAPVGDHKKLISGDNHACAIHATTKEIACWGDDSFGQTAAPTGAFKTLQAGKNHTCALADETGEITCWGDGGSGQTTAPSGTWSAVHAGGNTSCAAKAGGSLSEGLTCWGDNSSGQATPPETVEGLSLQWWSTIWDWQDVNNGPSKLALGETRSCGIMKTSTVNLGGALVCWGKNGVETYGSVVGYDKVTVHGDATCVVEKSGIGYCWGDHPAKTEPEPNAVVDAGEYSDAINEGLASFREVDASGNTCGSCHAPDGLDIVYHALPDDDFTRRTEKHVANQHVGPVVEMLNAHRDRYGWSPTVEPADWKPMQPSGSTLAGEVNIEKDAALAAALVESSLLIASSTIESVSDAEAARDQLLTLNLHDLPVGIEFPLYSRDKTRGKAHVNANEWVPSLGHIAAPGKKLAFIGLEDTYLADPTTSNFLNLLQAYTSTSNPLVAANTTECGIETHGKCDSMTATTVVSGNLNSIERQRQMSMLIISHEMRMHMAGTSSGLFSGGIDYPVNAIWNTGVLAEQSGEACTAARVGFGGPWDSNAASKAACVRMPDPWNSEHDRSTCTHSGRCDFSKDLKSFGVPWRWMGFMQNPALLNKSGDTVTSETTVAKKVQALTGRLTAAEYPTHGVLFLAKHRMERFFGSDQSWRGSSSLTDLQTEFASEFGMETSSSIRPGAHATTHALMVTNLRSMFELLSVAGSDS